MSKNIRLLHPPSSPSPPTLQTLLKSGFTPTLQDFNNFLISLCRARKFGLLFGFFPQMNSNNIKPNPQTHSILTWALLKDHKYEEAAQFMKTHMVKSSPLQLIRIQDALIQGLCNNRSDPGKGFAVLRDWAEIDGILPSSFTFCSLIRSFCLQGKMDGAIEVFKLMLKMKYPFDVFVCSWVISRLCRIGKPELAIDFFKKAENFSGLRSSIVIYTTIASAYCRLGKVEDVSELVSRMEKEGLPFDVVFYSNWIDGYFKEGNIREALQKYRGMVDKKIAMDTISYTILIDGFSKEGYVEKAVGFLHRMQKNGVVPDLVTYTAIMLGFSKKGKLEEAFAILKTVEVLEIEVDEFVYATLIDGVCKRGDVDRAFRMLKEMERKGIHPSTVTYNTLINGLCRAGRTSEADEFSKGMLGDAITYTTLLDGYIKEENAAGILETKRRLEEAGVCIDVIMCNVLIKALFLLGSFEDALAMYNTMPDMGLAANAITYCTMIDGYCKAGRMSEALEIFDVFRGKSISSPECYNCMIHGLCNRGMADLATEVFIELHERGFSSDAGIRMMLINSTFAEKGEEGVVNFVYRIENLKETFDTVSDDAISFLCKRGFLNAACDVYVLMKSKGSVVKTTSDYSIMKALNYYGKEWLVFPLLNSFVKIYGIDEPEVGKLLVNYLCMKDVNNALRLLRRMDQKNVSIVFTVNFLKKLVNDGRALDAYKLVIEREENLPPMDVVDYSMVIDGLCKIGKMKKALDLCVFAKRKGTTLNIITYNSVINGLRRHGCFVEAFRLFDALEKIDMFPTEITYATLIDTLSKEGSMLDARRLLESMILKEFKPNTRVYNSLIDGYCKQGKKEEALQLLLELEENGCKPDEFTVSSVINGYCEKGDMEGALQFFFEYQEKSLSPDFLGFMYLIRGLCAKGRMEECRNILRVMLRSQSVISLLKKAETEVQTESIEGFLVSLCEQGSIREAILVLNEVGSIFFPAARKGGAYTDPGKVQELHHRRELGTVESEFPISTYETEKVSGVSNAEAVKDMVELNSDVGKEPLFTDFDSYYAAIASLCSRGELDEANTVARKLFKSEKSQ